MPRKRKRDFIKWNWKWNPVFDCEILKFWFLSSHVNVIWQYGKHGFCYNMLVMEFKTKRCLLSVRKENIYVLVIHSIQLPDDDDNNNATVKNVFQKGVHTTIDITMSSINYNKKDRNEKKIKQKFHSFTYTQAIIGGGHSQIKPTQNIENLKIPAFSYVKVYGEKVRLRWKSTLPLAV